jgi:glycerol-3-phosphate dehydrogenase
MERDLTRLTSTAFDLVVVGGGIHGSCIAWDATLRGLRVALLERDDFGAATSANSLRIIHGGLRYLARGQLRRMRESIRERSAFLRIAPHFVEPLPVVVATAGAGARGRPAMAAALALNDLLSLDRNRGLDAARRLPRGRLLSLAECRRLFPAFPVAGASGGALWYDATVRHPERLTLAFVRSAAERGAVVANYCRVDRLDVENGAVRGVIATDLVGGGTVAVSGRAVAVAAGPWTAEVAGSEGSLLPQAFALNLQVAGRLAEAAIGFRAPTGPREDPIIGGRRYIFLAPQGDSTLLGTWYAPADGAPEAELIERGTAALLAEFQAACPALGLTAEDIEARQWGRLPLKAGRERGRPDALADRYRVMDHGANEGPSGIVSVEGVKFTTARQVAEVAVDRIVAILGVPTAPCRTLEQVVDGPEGALDPAFEPRIRRAIREEMALRLSDVVLRRIPPDAGPGPGRERVTAAARIAAAELGWTPAAQEAEIDDVLRRLRSAGRTPEPPA